MRMIYSEGYSTNERLCARSVIYSNILNSFEALLDTMEREGVEFLNDSALVTRIPFSYCGLVLPLIMMTLRNPLQGYQQALLKERIYPHSKAYGDRMSERRGRGSGFVIPLFQMCLLTSRFSTTFSLKVLASLVEALEIHCPIWPSLCLG